MQKQLLTACAFLHKDGKVFIAKRADSKDFLPGKFELPGGHVEFGETFQEGLARELMEEFGISVVVGNPVYAFTYTNEVKQSHSAEVIFLCTLKPDSPEPKLDPTDHSEYKWVSPEEATQYFEAGDEELKGIDAGFERIGEV